METKHRQLISILMVLAISLVACSGGGGLSLGGKKVTITMIYGSEKEEWLVPLVEEFNEAGKKTEAGSTIVVEATPMGSISSGDGIVAGTLQPTVWSPASSIFIPVANDEWRSREHSEDLVVGEPPDLVISPVVIALWQPMAEALGWPGEPIGWADIAAMATSEEGWAAFGYPEWGAFQFGHTHPNYSNSGLVSVIAEAYAGAEKRRSKDSHKGCFFQSCRL